MLSAVIYLKLKNCQTVPCAVSKIKYQFIIYSLHVMLIQLSLFFLLKYFILDFINFFQNITDTYEELEAVRGKHITRELLLHAKQLGFCDVQIGSIVGMTELAVRKLRVNNYSKKFKFFPWDEVGRLRKSKITSDDLNFINITKFI